MRLQLYRDSVQVDIDKILGPYLEERQGQASVPEIVDYLRGLMAAGQVVVAPGGDELIRLGLDALVRAWTQASSYENARRFLADRTSGRFDRRIGNVGNILEMERAAYLASIRRSLFVEGPAMYQSQAALLLALDPQTDVRALAAECGTLVRQAVESAAESETAAEPDALAQREAPAA